MNGTLKGATICVVSFGLIADAPGETCGPRDLCGIIADIGQHAPEREPGPEHTVDGIVVTITSTASTSYGVTIMR
jgi:hypothetical protein